MRARSDTALIASWPDQIAAGTRTDALVQYADVAPTLVELAGGRLNNPYWATWLGADPLKQPEVYQRVKRYMLRPPEQFYLTADDPYEMTNLADDPDHAETKSRLSAALDAWMKAQSDPGAAVDTPGALEAARRGEHLYGPGTGR